MTNQACSCQTPQPDRPVLYTVAQTAVLLGRSERTIRRMIARRELGSIRTPGTVRVSHRHLEAWMTLNEVPADTMRRVS